MRVVSLIRGSFYLKTKFRLDRRRVTKMKTPHLIYAEVRVMCIFETVNVFFKNETFIFSMGFEVPCNLAPLFFSFDPQLDQIALNCCGFFMTCFRSIMCLNEVREKPMSKNILNQTMHALIESLKY